MTWGSEIRTCSNVSLANCFLIKTKFVFIIKTVLTKSAIVCRFFIFQILILCTIWSQNWSFFSWKWNFVFSWYQQLYRITGKFWTLFNYSCVTFCIYCVFLCEPTPRLLKGMVSIMSSVIGIGGISQCGSFNGSLQYGFVTNGTICDICSSSCVALSHVGNCGVRSSSSASGSRNYKGSG